MPALPWRTVSERPAEGAYLALVSRLELRRHRDVPAFLRAATAITRQLDTSPGLVGYALDARIMRRTFWTLSLWLDDDAVSRFVRAAPHVEVMRTWHGRLADTAVHTWPHASGRPTWDEARERVGTAGRRSVDQ